MWKFIKYRFNKAFAEENTFKVRPGIAYDKFYLNWIDGSYDMSLQGLIHHFMFEKKLYHKFLTKEQLESCTKVVNDLPESIYSPDEGSERDLLDEIQSSIITFVGKKLIDLGFDVKETFKEYLE